MTCLRCVTPKHCSNFGCSPGAWPTEPHECTPNSLGECGKCGRQNVGMVQSTADRQRAYKQAMKEAGYVRLESYVTREQREKFRTLGGDEWLRKKIDAAKVKNPTKGS